MAYRGPKTIKDAHRMLLDKKLKVADLVDMVNEQIHNRLHLNSYINVRDIQEQMRDADAA